MFTVHVTYGKTKEHAAASEILVNGRLFRTSMEGRTKVPLPEGKYTINVAGKSKEYEVKEGQNININIE